MKHKLIAMTAAFQLAITPMTAHAGSVIVVEPEEPVNLEDYTTSYDALHEAGHIMYSGNQVLIHWDLPVMTEGCEIIPNTMEWEVYGTADVTFATDSFFKSVSYEENYANTYCLITANSPGSVHVVGTEYSLYDSDGTEFYFNLTVGGDGNFEETFNMDNPIEPIISEDSVYFPKPDLPCEFSLLVSSNLESTAVHENGGYTFTPEEDGWYVVSTRSYCEEIVSYGESGHFHYFYPVLHNYVVIADDKGIRVNHWGDKSWYSEEQISEAIAEAGNDENIACYDVYAAQPDDVMHGAYFSFVNGQLPTVQGDYDSYITNVYTEYGTDSYFCVNYCSADIQQDMNGNEPQRVTAEEQDISSLLTHFWTSRTCDGDLTTPSPDIMEFTRIAAPESDGDLTVLVDNLDAVYTYPLTVENGIFHHRIVISEVPADVNNDGTFSVADAVMLQKWLLCKGKLTCPQKADLTGEGIVNAFDLALMKNILLYGIRFDWDSPENDAENQAAAKRIGDYALAELKSGNYTLDTEVSHYNASDLMSAEMAEFYRNSDFYHFSFVDEHTVHLRMNKGLLDAYGYLITDGAVSFEMGRVTVPDEGYDGDFVQIEWIGEDLYYFTAGT
ncbi:MAG: dockerin type I repeat-containing protein [Oscillospiraceae bacterium]|nr:dockerin type I repeat-containing protein [Oscillospiraceae bacterium]